MALLEVRGQKLKANMSGDQEVQEPDGPKVGDKNGDATGFVFAQDEALDYVFMWTKISAPTLGHIHQGDKGKNGDVVVPLFATAMPEGVDAVRGTVTDVDKADLLRIKFDPKSFYLNLHTAEFPGGAVRGQLHAPKKLTRR